MHATHLTILLAMIMAVTANAELPNLLPNGDCENEIVNCITRERDQTSSIQANGTGIPTYWRFSGDVQLSTEEKYAGRSALELRGDKTSATALSNFWRVKDPAMPFETPLLTTSPVQVSFYYKTGQQGEATASIRLGVIEGLASETETIPLPAAKDWTRVERSIWPEELLWGAQVSFALKGDAVLWVDNVRVTQRLPNAQNLVHNAGFERPFAQSTWPAAWENPVEDQWVSWVGRHYRPAHRSDLGGTTGGRYALRATVAYVEISGVSQGIVLDQERPRPVVIGIHSKLDNSIGNPPQGYYGSDNLPLLTVYVHHQDGTMQEVSPTFSLGESDHDWDYRRGGFLPQKPVHKMRLQVTVIGTEPTTSLWIDDVTVFELADKGETPPSVRYAPNRELTARWDTHAMPQRTRIVAANDALNLYLSVPRRGDDAETYVYLNPDAEARFITHERFLYDYLHIAAAAGTVRQGEVAEKLGYIARGEAAAQTAVTLERTPGTDLLTVPFRALGLDGPPERPIGFNVAWESADGTERWTGRAINLPNMGSLVTAPPPGIVIRSVRFGDRYTHDRDQSQDLITHPPLYAARNTARVHLINHGLGTGLNLRALISGKEVFAEDYDFDSGESKVVSFDYDAGADETVQFSLFFAEDPARAYGTDFWVSVPPALEIVPDQEFYYPEEPEATLEIHSRLRPLPKRGRIVLEVEDLVSGDTVLRAKHPLTKPINTVAFPIDALRINDLPVQDYRVTVSYYAGRDLQGTASADIGRIRHTQRRPLPPIERVRVDDAGRLIINDDFRFFPIVPSLASATWDEAVAMGANINRAYYKPLKAGANNLQVLDDTWRQNVYTLFLGPPPGLTEQFEQEAATLLSHPGMLTCYAKQFYYWNLSDELVAYRKDVERIFRAQPSPRLLIWGHHDSSFLYDLDTDWPREYPPVGYCYTKILGRPGSGWRNSPLLTRTEQVLDPRRFKLAEVNYYLTWHDDEIVPEHFMTYLSLRGNDWRGFRNESYLSFIYGANGIYHYICTQPGELKRLRGWFQELNHMWPVYVADDAPNQVTVTPIESGIEARLKAYDGKLYLLTANAAEREWSAEIVISGLEGMRVEKLFGVPGATQVRGDRIADTWGEYDAFVYRIEQ